MSKSEAKIEKWADEFFNSGQYVSDHDLTYAYKCYDDSRDRLSIIARKMQVLQAAVLTLAGFVAVALRFTPAILSLEFLALIATILLLVAAFFIFYRYQDPKCVDALPDVPDILNVTDLPSRNRNIVIGLYEIVEAHDRRATEDQNSYRGMITALALAFGALVFAAVFHVAGL